MARRKSHQSNEEETSSKRGGLKPAFSSQVGGNKYVVYADTKKQGEDHPRVCVKSFLAEYAARFFIDKLISPGTWQWSDPVGSRKCIETSDGVRISMFGDHLELLMSYEMTPEEAEWSDEQTLQSARMLKYGQNFEAKKTVVEEIIEDEETGETKVVKVKQKKEKKEKREKKAKIDKTGSVTAQDLASKLKIEPRVFRGALRALKLQKPEGGWHWPKKEADEVFKQVEKELKRTKKIK